VSDLETAWRQVLDAVDRIPGSVFVVFNAAFPDSGDSPVYSCSIGTLFRQPYGADGDTPEEAMTKCAEKVPA
jgi:hypothetical protein